MMQTQVAVHFPAGSHNAFVFHSWEVLLHCPNLYWRDSPRWLSCWLFGFKNVLHAWLCLTRMHEWSSLEGENGSEREENKEESSCSICSNPTLLFPGFWQETWSSVSSHCSDLSVTDQQLTQLLSIPFSEFETEGSDGAGMWYPVRLTLGLRAYTRDTVHNI